LTHPFRRRPDSPAFAHERARSLAAERLVAPLEPAEGDWLDAHLAACVACRGAADGYERDRLELRAFRRQPIEPPRDLWARTSAAIELEAGARSRGAARRRGLSSSVVPLGAISGLLVVAVVFGASLLSSRAVPSVTPPTASLFAFSFAPSSTGRPEPTPLSVPQGNVDYLAVGDDGTLAMHTAEYSEVCPDNGAKCRPLRDAVPLHIDVPDAPDQAIMAPDEDQIVVAVDGQLLVVPAPTPAGPVGGPTGPPDETASPTPTATTEPTATIEPTGSAQPTVSAEPTESAEPTTSVPPTTEPSPSEDPTPSASGEPTLSPSPSIGPGTIAIAEDVVLVGHTEFDAAGNRFAFSARPADGSAGPDIFVWTVGEAQATPVTTDHRSVFSGWRGDLVLGSRPVDPAAAETMAETFLVDPETGTEAVVGVPSAWRPTVDPDGERAVYWIGTIARDESGVEWAPADGQLVVGTWPVTPELVAPSAEPERSADPAATAEPTSPVPGSDDDGGASVVEVLADGPVRNWEARWDEAGGHLAVWIADPDDATIGRLSLYAVDRVGTPDLDEPQLRGEVARPGFSIEDGHLAWATKDGQDGKASHVRIVAWTDDGIGQIETPTGEDVLIVQR
jgi:hypothetical protein